MSDFHYINDSGKGFYNSVRFFNVGDIVELGGAQYTIRTRSRFVADVLFYGYNVEKNS